MRQDSSESGAHSQQCVDYGILEMMHQVKQVLMQFPNGALFLLHPSSRPGWGDLAAFNPGVRLAFFCSACVWFLSSANGRVTMDVAGDFGGRGRGRGRGRGCQRRVRRPRLHFFRFTQRVRVFLLAREAENAASSEAFALRAVARVRRRAALLSATSF